MATRRIHYWLQALDSEAAVAWAIAAAVTLFIRVTVIYAVGIAI